MLKRAPPLLLIGSSTGGPSALVKLFKSLGLQNPFATVLIQHIDEKFSKGMADWLHEQTELPVAIIYPGILPEAGKILLAGEDQHHVVIEPTGELSFSSIMEHSSYKPSIDVLFTSVAKNWPHPGVAALLTGMGNDGAKGLLALREAGWETVAESKDTCTVYGMPKAAIDNGGAKHILPIDDIGPSLLKWHKKNEHTNSGFYL